MNIVFGVFVFVSFLCAALRQFGWVPTPEAAIPPIEILSKAMIDAATGSVDLAISLVGVMTLFLGLVKVAEAGGMLTILARLIRPVMIRLFPDVPSEHPAMGAMILNLSANALGLGNAATPFGIRAMQELDKLNENRGTATNAMALFLAINTSSVTLLPTGVIALRAAAGSSDPGGILPTTLLATIGSTTAAILATKFYQRFFPLQKTSGVVNNTMPITPSPEVQTSDGEQISDPIPQSETGYPAWVSSIALCLLAAVVPIMVVYGKSISPWIVPGLMVGFLGFGIIRRVRIYEEFVEGAKEGFQVAVKIIPYLVAILVAVGMLRASGALEATTTWLGRWTETVGLPAEALPMALLRPLSGNGAFGILAAIINDPAIGPDSYTGYLVSTLQGSTETTFYVLAVYYGSIQIRKIRHTLAAALTADIAGLVFAVAACAYLYR